MPAAWTQIAAAFLFPPLQLQIADDDVINLRPRQQLSTAVAMRLERSGHELGISGGKAQQMEGVAIA